METADFLLTLSRTTPDSELEAHKGEFVDSRFISQSVRSVPGRTAVATSKEDGRCLCQLAPRGSVPVDVVASVLKCLYQGRKSSARKITAGPLPQHLLDALEASGKPYKLLRNANGVPYAYAATLRNGKLDSYYRTVPIRSFCSHAETPGIDKCTEGLAHLTRFMRKAFPEATRNMLKAVRDTGMQALPGMPFADRVQCSYNVPVGMHRDHDASPVMVIFVTGHGFSSFPLVLPGFGLSIDLQPGDAVALLSTEVHGTGPLILEPGYQRNALIFFVKGKAPTAAKRAGATRCSHQQAQKVPASGRIARVRRHGLALARALE
jgi:hypothetical protein